MEEDFNPKIGKTALETLTSGMYDDARFIFREYIQNSADQIDVAVEAGILSDKTKGKIEVKISPEFKRIVIEDNATGISAKNILQFLGDVANSKKKRNTQKGFRGIGRLGGLGYCDKLIFETSFSTEETGSRLIIDAKLLEKIIQDRQNESDASTAITIVTSIEKFTEASEAHYFRVILENVGNEKVLDVGSVTEYLSMVAPIPFNQEFTFSSDIKNYFDKKDIVLDEYYIELNEKPLVKAYKNTFPDGSGDMSNLIGVGFIDIFNDDQELLGVCWYGYGNYSNNVLAERNYERGIRIRTKNITIGNENTCNRFFDTPRTNHRFIGEIHTLSNGFIPNARRDYFIENHTCKQFEQNAKAVFKLENLENNLAQTASKLHNRLKEINKYQSALEDYRNNKGNFINANTESYYLNNLKVLEKKALNSERVIKSINIKADQVPAIRALYNTIIGTNEITVEKISPDESQVSQYDPPTFNRLNDQERQVVLDIFHILEEQLPFYDSENLKKMILEKFN
jgi:molecular chaperone HtpG